MAVGVGCDRVQGVTDRLRRWNRLLPRRPHLCHQDVQAAPGGTRQPQELGVGDALWGQGAEARAGRREAVRMSRDSV